MVHIKKKKKKRISSQFCLQLYSQDGPRRMRSQDQVHASGVVTLQVVMTQDLKGAFIGTCLRPPHKSQVNYPTHRIQS